MALKVLREITPLTDNDCFTLFYREKERFDFPLHYHEEYELNFIRGAAGARRVVGNHEGVIGDWELVLLGSNLPHGWFDHQCALGCIREVTIQFHGDFLDHSLLKRDQLKMIRKMFATCSHGVLFTEQTARQIAPRLEKLDHKQGFSSVLALMAIFHELSLSEGKRVLSGEAPLKKAVTCRKDAISRTLRYLEDNFAKQITLGELASLCGMQEESFGRFFKRKTGYSFKEILNEVRISNAARMLIDTTLSINEVAFSCGFRNLSLFHRQFKKDKQCTPTEYREGFAGTQVIA